MAIPEFLASYYYFYQHDNVTDVQEIIDDWRTQTMLPANIPAWENPSGNIFNPPIDGYSRIFSITLTRASAILLVLELKNQNGVTITTRGLQLSPDSGAIVRYYWGNCHFCIDVQNNIANEPDYVYGGLLDPSPELPNAHSNYVWGYGSRSSGGTYSTVADFRWAYMLDDGIAQTKQRICDYLINIGGRPAPQRDMKGYRLFQPVKLWAGPVTGAFRYAGRAYQMLFVPSDSADVGAAITIPIDAGVTGKFRMLGGTPHTTRLLSIAIQSPDED